MYCMHCGEEIPDSSRFCKYCGKKVAAESIKAENQASASAEPQITDYVPQAESAAAVPVREEYEIADGFFFKGLHPMKKFLLFITGIVIMFLTAFIVFISGYPDLVGEVFNFMR